MKRPFILLFLFVLLLSACADESDKSDQFVTVEPSKLFQGDAKRLEPHLEIMGGAVKVSYSGSHHAMNTKYEIWEDGKLVNSGRALGMEITEDALEEVTVSLKNDPDKESDFLVTVVFASEENGYNSAAFSIPKFDPSRANGHLELDEPIQFKEGAEEAIWGYTANEDGHISSGDDLEKIAKEADWAFLLKLTTDKSLD
ncbi:hypothetical protein [Domibacillus epiphyticus]|uniref:Uncharacterized protein n=1 Tax=Domibacillus epiphyticus TaxID=1714355 RepID=A0A1V2A3W2_9BACI|nr:hypothetical protein [Domibacillus epiphyticus]OMP65698.1 hypothetical protein BTO28_16215 [Domibacillus epiphyticus]